MCCSVTFSTLSAPDSPNLIPLISTRLGRAAYHLLETSSPAHLGGSTSHLTHRHVRIKWHLAYSQLHCHLFTHSKHANGHVKQASWRGVRSDTRRATYIEGHAWVLIPEVYRLVLVRGVLPLLSPLRLLLLRPTPLRRLANKLHHRLPPCYPPVANP